MLIKINDKNIQVNNDSKDTLLEILDDAGYSLPRDCAGNGICGKCAVKIKGITTPEDEDNKQDTISRELLQWNRAKVAGTTSQYLSCLVTRELLLTQEQLSIELLSEISSVDDIQVDTGVSITNNDSKRQDNLDNSDVRRILSNDARTNESLFKDYKNESEGTLGKSLAIAIDIGTTTIALALVDVSNGDVINVVSMTNSGRKYGSDVISRIRSASGSMAEEITTYLRQDILEGINKVCTNNGTSRKSATGDGLSESIESVEHILIAGNTTMCHILMGYDCSGLGTAPYTPVNIDRITTNTRTLLGMQQELDIMILPGVSTYVGADIVSGMIATNMYQNSDISLLVDLGTNGEMAIGNRDKILVSSTAAGPAFEAGNISCGMASVAGAINHVTITQAADSWKCNITTINDAEPIGICGTGVIEIIYELRRNNIIDETGLLIDEYFDNGFPLTDNIIFTQDDIREFQMAKGAVRAGIEILIEEYGINYNDIKTLNIAGSFGYAIDVDKASAIGLLPEGMNTQAVGNSSLGGCIALIREEYNMGEESKSTEITHDLDILMNKIIANSTEVELSNHSKFQEYYMQYMYL